MKALEQHRFSEMVKRVLNAKSTQAVFGLNQAISPALDVQDGYRPEQRAIRGERLWGCSLQLTQGTAINTSTTMVLVNPTGSQRIAVMRRVTASALIPGSAVQAVDTVGFFVTRPQAEGSTGAGMNGKDSRNLLTQSTQFTTRTGLAATTLQTIAINAVWGIQVPIQAAASPFIIDHDQEEVVLFPGFTCDIGFRVSAQPTVAWNSIVSIDGFERPFEAAEVTQVA